ncbi:hypothetical protein JL722_8065 [Aureococcus anophagefferens]|nr:hypothetical protein JL722_8065 [Aureococcus anophagefferens]
MRRAIGAAAFAVLLCAATAENRRAGAYALEKCKSGPMPAKLVLACNNATDAWNAEDGCDRDDDDDDDDDDDEPRRRRQAMAPYASESDNDDDDSDNNNSVNDDNDGGDIDVA